MTDEELCVCGHPEDEHDGLGLCALCDCVAFRVDGEDDLDTEPLNFDDDGDR